MSKIGLNCPPTMFDWQCKLLGWETKSEAEQKNLEAEKANAELYYPSIRLNDGNYVNFYWLTKVTCIAGENTAMYKDVWGTSQPIKAVAKGQALGVPQVYNESNPQWIGFYKDGKSHYWVYLKDNTIDAKSLYNKGVKNDAQIQEDKKNAGKNWADTLGESLTSAAKWGTIGIGLYLAYDAIKSTQSKTRVAGLKVGKTGQIILGVGIGYLIAKEMGLFDAPKPSLPTINPPTNQKLRSGATMQQTQELEQSSIEGFNVYNDFY